MVADCTRHPPAEGPSVACAALHGVVGLRVYLSGVCNATVCALQALQVLHGCRLACAGSPVGAGTDVCASRVHLEAALQM
jgi:hypothetical protein